MEEFAVEQEHKAIYAAEERLKQRKIAEMNADEAMRQNQRAEEALKKTKK